jgi:DNA polymerase III sliding clamp (beta) subunit (PCNA family)
MKTEIEIPVAELKTALPGFSKIIGKKTTLPILGCVKVSLDESKALIQIEATNLEETVLYRLQNQTGGLPGAVIVPFEDLAKIIKGSKDTVRIVAEEKRTLIRYPLAGGFVDQPVDKIGLNEWPALPVIDSTPVALSGEFKETLQQAIQCSSSDESRYVLNGVCLDVTAPQSHYVVGSDGRHLYAANTFQFALDTSVTIPSKRFLSWNDFLQDGPWFLRTIRKPNGSPWLRIDSDRWSYIAKQIEENYPNWKQVVPTVTSDWTKLMLDEKAVEMMLGVIPMLPGGGDVNEPVDVIVAKKGVTIVGRDKTRRNSKAQIEGIHVTGQPVEFSINRTYLLKALRFGFRELHTENPLSPVVFTNGGRTMVVMPLRGEAAEKYASKHPPKNSPPNGASAQTEAPPGGPGPAEVPSPAEPKTNEATAERKSMDSTMQAPQRGNLTSHEPKSDTTTAVDEVLAQIEKVKEDLRAVFNDLNETERLLKKVAKEQKVTEKEIGKVRASLRTLQSVEI